MSAARFRAHSLMVAVLLLPGCAALKASSRQDGAGTQSSQQGAANVAQAATVASAPTSPLSDGRGPASSGTAVSMAQGAGNVTAQGNKGLETSGNVGNTGLSYVSGFGIGAVCVVIAAILTAWLAIRSISHFAAAVLQHILRLTHCTGQWSHERAMARLAALGAERARTDPAAAGRDGDGGGDYRGVRGHSVGFRETPA